MVFWSTKTGISAKYTFSSSPTFAAEPWNIYTGRPKSTSLNSNGKNTKVSVFIFDKKQFENYLLNYGIIKSKSSSRDKQLLQEGYEILRNQVNNLAKLKHPNILTIIEPLEEHSKNFMFVTEYVVGSLETFFKNDMDDEEQDFLQGHIKNDIIIQRGIQQVVKGLDFIHNRATSVHLDIQPRSVFINDNSDWKISGFGHLVKLPQGTNTSDYIFPQYDPRVPKFMTLNLDFTAPELIFENTLCVKNDYFSLGLLINFLYNGDNVLFKTDNSLSDYKDEYSRFEKKIMQLSWDNTFNKVPQKLRICIPKLMNRDIYSRYENITEIFDNEFFQDPLIKTLNFLDELPTKSNEEKAVFLDGLIQLLPQFPAALLQRKFLPILLTLLTQLCNDKITDAHCISRDFEIIIKIGSTLSQLTFSEKILPVIIHQKNFPILLQNAPRALIENLSLLKQKIKLSDFVNTILTPLMKYVLQDRQLETMVTIQEQLLGQISLILDCLDFPAVKNSLLPILAELFTKTTSLTVKVTCVSCFETLIERKCIDSYTCTEDIIPLFKAMKTRDSRILLKSLNLFERIPTLITDEVVLVETVLPLLWNYSMSSTLKKSQYFEFVRVINQLSSDIQKKHADRLNANITTSDTSSESNDTKTTFNKIIDTRTKLPSAAELDNQASKNVNIPVIKPTTKANTSTGGNSIVVTPNTKKPFMNSTIKPPPKNNINIKSSTIVSTSYQNPNGFGATHSTTDSIPSRNEYLSRVHKSPLPDLPNSTTNTQPNVTNTSRNTDFNTNRNDGDSMKSTPPPPPLPPTSSLPPGFSLPLQPSKKKSSSPSPFTPAAQSDSLI